jgi:hypothetical protein
MITGVDCHVEKLDEVDTYHLNEGRVCFAFAGVKLYMNYDKAYEIGRYIMESVPANCAAEFRALEKAALAAMKEENLPC